VKIWVIDDDGTRARVVRTFENPAEEDVTAAILKIDNKVCAYLADGEE
jgi:hypothetical protein